MNLVDLMRMFFLPLTLLGEIVISGAENSRADDNLDLNGADIQNFEAYLEEVVRCKKVTSGTITLVKDDRVVLARGFGHVDVEKKFPATNRTKFCVGSLTKAFTSAVVAKVLSEHKNVTWNTPLKDILGDGFRLSDDQRTKHANLRDLMGHRLGVPSHFLALLVGFPENMTRDEFVRRIQYQKPKEEFRAKFLYSNYMFTLAGQVAEKLTGRSWEDLVTEYFLQPLGMRNSGFVDRVKDFSEFSPSFSFIDGKPTRNEPTLLYAVSPSGPAGSIYTNAEDMGPWMMLHLNQGNSTGRILVPAEYLKETHTGQMMTPFSTNSEQFKPEYPIVDAAMVYNMGWVTSVYRGYKKIWHSGGIVNYSSLLWLFPDKNAGVYVTITGATGNRKGPAIYAITSAAADLLLGEERWLNHTTACTYPAPWTTPDPPTIADGALPPYSWNISRDANDYAGTYVNPAFQDMVIRVEKTTELKLYFGRFGVFKLYPISEEKFDAYLLDDLAYVTNSDDNTKPFHIKFDITDERTILHFPFIPAEDIVDFVKVSRQRSKTNPISTKPQATTADNGGGPNFLCGLNFILIFTVMFSMNFI